MSGLLVISEHRQGELTPASLECITAARRLKTEKNQSLMVAVLASDPDQYSAQLNLDGVDEIIRINTPEDEFQVDTHEAAIGALISERQPTVILVPHSVDAWSYAPVIAMRGNYGFATDVFGISYEGDELVATRAAYAEKIHMELDFPNKNTVLLTVRGNTFKPAEGSGNAEMTDFDLPEFEMHTQHVEFIEPEAGGDVDITQAEYMLSIGRGIAAEDNVEEFLELADSMGFTVGCSRPIADSGWLPKSRQVGQSGKTVADCNVYIAMGISGSVQHMAGMKHVPNIIAVNKDPEASIFSIARYGVVADLFEIADELRNNFA
jgi:electron transfer flavoprotein alpha subunit